VLWLWPASWRIGIAVYASGVREIRVGTEQVGELAFFVGVDEDPLVSQGDRPSGHGILPVGRGARAPRPGSGQPPKLIDEYVGQANTGYNSLSIAHMRSPSLIRSAGTQLS
jgi:hypothetical protein